MVDVTDATFETEVLARSEEVAVVVDLWADWCGPCRTLGPILEQVIGETDGEVVLAKVDTDGNPGISEAFQVQSIPAVHAVRNRQVVASFIGARPESEVRQFVEALRPTEAEREVAALLSAGDRASLEKVLEVVPGHPDATVALAEIHVGEGRGEEALALLAKVPETAEVRRVAALARTGAGPATEGGTSAALDGVDAKLGGLLDRVRDDETARQEFLDLLELLGPDDPRTAGWRKELTRRLF